MADIREKLSKRYSLQRMYKTLNNKQEIIHPNLLRVTIPTLPYESFDSAGEKVLPWQLMKFLDNTDIAIFYSMNQDIEALPGQPERYTYLVKYELQIDSSLYDIDSPKHPLIVDYTMRYAKTTSKSLVATLRHPSRGKPYAIAEYVDVFVDGKFRKPVPIPESWKIRHQIPSEGQRHEHIVPARHLDTKTMETEHKVVYSDLDANGHANYTFYARTCLDSFAENLFSGLLTKDAELHFKNGMKALRMTFYKECLLRDKVKVISWCKEGSTDTYYFDVRKGKDLGARLTIVFY